MITVEDLKQIKPDNKESIAVIAYKCTNCHQLEEEKENADHCCD